MDVEGSRELNLVGLTNGFPMISSAFCQVLAEAASVCLEDQKHGLDVEMTVTASEPRAYSVRRLEVTKQAANTYVDDVTATEWGALGMAFLLVQDLYEDTVLQQSCRGPGFDYWIGEADNDEELPPFQKKKRLEVSGIRHAGPYDIDKRVRKKLRQVSPSDGVASAVIVVVDFGAPASKVVDK